MCSIHVTWNITELEYISKKKLSSCEQKNHENGYQTLNICYKKYKTVTVWSVFMLWKIMAVSLFFQSERTLNQKNYISMCKSVNYRMTRYTVWQRI